jgi:hypothetical protein
VNIVNICKIHFYYNFGRNDLNGKAVLFRYYMHRSDIAVKDDAIFVFVDNGCYAPLARTPLLNVQRPLGVS